MARHDSLLPDHLGVCNNTTDSDHMSCAVPINHSAHPDNLARSVVNYSSLHRSLLYDDPNGDDGDPPSILPRG
jgi:hypothetical protein